MSFQSVWLTRKDYDGTDAAKLNLIGALDYTQSRLAIPSISSSATDWVPILRWSFDVGEFEVRGDSFPSSLNVFSITSSVEYHWLLQRRDSAGNLIASSDSSPAFAQTGQVTHTFTFSQAWQLNDILSLEVQIRRTSAGRPVNEEVHVWASDTLSYVDADLLAPHFSGAAKHGLLLNATAEASLGAAYEDTTATGFHTYRVRAIDGEWTEPFEGEVLSSSEESIVAEAAHGVSLGSGAGAQAVVVAGAGHGITLDGAGELVQGAAGDLQHGLTFESRADVGTRVRLSTGHGLALGSTAGFTARVQATTSHGLLVGASAQVDTADLAVSSLAAVAHGLTVSARGVLHALVGVDLASGVMLATFGIAGGRVASQMLHGLALGAEVSSRVGNDLAVGIEHGLSLGTHGGVAVGIDAVIDVTHGISLGYEARASVGEDASLYVLSGLYLGAAVQAKASVRSEGAFGIRVGGSGEAASLIQTSVRTSLTLASSGEFRLAVAAVGRHGLALGTKAASVLRVDMGVSHGLQLGARAGLASSLGAQARHGLGLGATLEGDIAAAGTVLHHGVALGNQGEAEASADASFDHGLVLGIAISALHGDPGRIEFSHGLTLDAAGDASSTATATSDTGHGLALGVQGEASSSVTASQESALVLGATATVSTGVGSEASSVLRLGATVEVEVIFEAQADHGLALGSFSVVEVSGPGMAVTHGVTLGHSAYAVSDAIYGVSLEHGLLLGAHGEFIRIDPRIVDVVVDVGTISLAVVTEVNRVLIEDSVMSAISVTGSVDPRVALDVEPNTNEVRVFADEEAI